MDTTYSYRHLYRKAEIVLDLTGKVVKSKFKFPKLDDRLNLHQIEEQMKMDRRVLIIDKKEKEIVRKNFN